MSIPEGATTCEFHGRLPGLRYCPQCEEGKVERDAETQLEVSAEDRKNAVMAALRANGVSAEKAADMVKELA